MTKLLKRRKLSRGLRKYIRRAKGSIRRTVIGEQARNQKIFDLYASLGLKY